LSGRTIPLTLAFALVIGLVTHASVNLTRFEGGVSSVWVANGILTGVLLLSPRASWPRWLAAAGLAQVLARLLLANAPTAILGLTAANLLEAWMVAFWIRRASGELRNLASLPHLARNAMLGTLVASAVSASLGVLFARVSTGPVESWLTWYVAHVLGMVVMATLTVCALQPGMHFTGRVGHRADYAACIGLLVLTCVGVFGQSRFPLLFLAYLPLLLLTFRHRLSGMVVGVVVLGIASGIAAAHGAGPFALAVHGSRLQHLLLWQVFLAASCLLAYPTAVAMTERRRLVARLRDSEARLNLIADNLPASITYIDADSRYRYANAMARKSPEGGRDPIGRHLREVRGEATYAQVVPHVEAVLRGEPRDFDAQFEIEGQLRDFRVAWVPDVRPDGRVPGYFSVAYDVTQAKRNERELERLARFDTLTGLPNRRQFEETLAAAVIRAQRLHAPLMLLSLDVDHFKKINDSFGHAAGDEVLREFARRLRETVYDVDLVARIGGDEFVVLVEYSPVAAVGEMVAARVVESLLAPVRAGGADVLVGTSVGIGLHHPVQSAEQLLALADQALYLAKARGRNTWAVAEG
jgi:diguanylate cyclase (GGDEF)-like protein/PAS domain S-box-containing protein